MAQSTKSGYVDRPQFEIYSRKFAAFFHMERRDGIILVRMHDRGGSAKFDFAAHNAWGQAWHEIGNDPANEVMILTGTGEEWIGNHEMTFEESLEKRPAVDVYDEGYYDGLKAIENLLFDIDIPTIAAVNGPGTFTMLGLICDITLCAESAAFFDCHFSMGIVPGDGQHLAFQELIGTKRAAYHLYTGAPIDAHTALQLGLVNEVLPSERLLPRAWEIAAAIMQKPRIVRRMTSQVVRRPWKRRVVDDLQLAYAHEQLCVLADAPNPKLINSVLKDSMVQAKKSRHKKPQTR